MLWLWLGRRPFGSTEQQKKNKTQLVEAGEGTRGDLVTTGGGHSQLGPSTRQRFHSASMDASLLLLLRRERTRG